MRCSKSVSVQQVLIVVSCLLACCATAWADTLRVWNRLESEYNVEHSDYGPNLYLRNYIYDSWDEAYIAPAKFGDGLCVNHDTNQGLTGDGANFFALDLWEAGLTANQGTIDFWFKYGYDCSVHNTAFFFHTADELTGHFDHTPTETGVRLFASWAGWNGYSDRKRFHAYLAEEGKPSIAASTPANSAGPGGYLAFAPGTIQHFGMMWDVDGIDGTMDTMRIYVNGALEGANTATWDDSAALQRYLYIGAKPNVDPYDHHYNAVKGITDNIKVWDYAAIDAIEHRNDEFYTPEPGTLLLFMLSALAIRRLRR